VPGITRANSPHGRGADSTSPIPTSSEDRGPVLIRPPPRQKPVRSLLKKAWVTPILWDPKQQTWRAYVGFFNSAGERIYRGLKSVNHDLLRAKIASLLQELADAGEVIVATVPCKCPECKTIFVQTDLALTVTHPQKHGLFFFFCDQCKKETYWPIFKPGGGKK